jgi:hypothetical protein
VNNRGSPLPYSGFGIAEGWHSGSAQTYLTEHISERRGNASGNDMLTHLMQGTGDGGMSDNEILGLCWPDPTPSPRRSASR